MVTFLWRAAGCPKPNNTGDVQFADIDRNAYYYEAVLWAVEQGITNGTGNGAFRPNATVTRGQTAAFLYRAAGSPSVNTKPGFTDIHVNDYYADAVAWAEKNGITSGVGEARYNPSGDAPVLKSFLSCIVRKNSNPRIEGLTTRYGQSLFI